MVESYRQALRALLEKGVSDAGLSAAIEVKHFFGGAAAYADGRIFATLSPAGFALKLPEDRRAALLSDGAIPLRYFPKSPIKKDYVILPEEMSREGSRLAALLAESLSFCRAKRGV
jgi:TfoX/Sxy family transcriptional regulator of competence genes